MGKTPNLEMVQMTLDEERVRRVMAYRQRFLSFSLKFILRVSVGSTGQGGEDGECGRAGDLVSSADDIAKDTASGGHGECEIPENISSSDGATAKDATFIVSSSSSTSVEAVGRVLASGGGGGVVGGGIADDTAFLSSLAICAHSMSISKLYSPFHETG